MPIQRTLPKHDPTSPECLVAKSQLEESALWKKAAEAKMITCLVEIVCALVVTAAVVITAVAVCNWTATHHDMLWFYPWSK